MMADYRFNDWGSVFFGYKAMDYDYDNDKDGLIDEDVGERNPPSSFRIAIIDSLAIYKITNTANFIPGL